jgi:tetratricopeptide (TPR) repeat protein
MRESQNLAGVAELLNRIGDVHYEVGDQDTAKRYYQEALQMSRETGGGWAGAVRGRATQLMPSVSDSKHHQTRDILLGVLNIAQQHNDTHAVTETLKNLAVNARQHGDDAYAFGVLAFLAQWSQTPDELADEIETLVFDLQDKLPPQEAADIWERAKKTDLRSLINTL